jgi:hypothetical protein
MVAVLRLVRKSDSRVEPIIATHDLVDRNGNNLTWRLRNPPTHPQASPMPRAVPNRRSQVQGGRTLRAALFTMTAATLCGSGAGMPHVRIALRGC